MIKQYTIKSKSLNSLNEALEKMALKDDVKIIRSPILEADGNFSSIVSSNSNNFDPSKINSNILVDKQDQDEDVIEKKNSLTAKVLDKIKQSLETSDELQGLLSKIDKLNKDTNYNTWKANEEQNTAYLKSKNAYIFLQNDNICLSHDNQVEIFKSVNELHDWLKKHNYPLPKSIKLHESVLNEDYFTDKLTKEQELNKINKEIDELKKSLSIDEDLSELNIKSIIKQMSFYRDIDYEKKHLPIEINELKKQISDKKNSLMKPKLSAELKKAEDILNELNTVDEEKIKEKYNALYKEYLNRSHKRRDLKNAEKADYEKNKYKLDNLYSQLNQNKQDIEDLNTAYSKEISELQKQNKENPYSTSNYINQSKNTNEPEKTAEELGRELLSKNKKYEEQKPYESLSDNINDIKKELSNVFDKDEMNNIIITKNIDDFGNNIYVLRSRSTKKLPKDTLLKKLPSKINFKDTNLLRVDNDSVYVDEDTFNNNSRKQALSKDEYEDKLKRYMGKWFTALHMEDRFKKEQIDPEELKKQKIAGLTKPNAYAPMSWEDSKLAYKMMDEPKKESTNMYEDAFDTSNLWYLVYQNPTRDETFYLNDNWEEGNLLSNNLQQASAFLNREEAIDTLKILYSSKQTQYPFKPMQEKALGECGVTCGSLGPAVQYTAKKEDLQEDDLQEMSKYKAGDETKIGDLRLGDIDNATDYVLRNATNWTSDNKEDLEKIADREFKKKRAQQWSRQYLNSDNARHSLFKKNPELSKVYLTLLKPKQNLLSPENKDKFIAALQANIDELEEKDRFDANAFIRNDEEGNSYYDPKNISSDLKSKEKVFRDYMQKNYFDPYFKMTDRAQSSQISKLAANTSTNFDSEEERENSMKYAQNVQSAQELRDVLNHKTHLNTKKAGVRRHLNTVNNNPRLKPYLDKFMTLANDGETSSNLIMWLMKNILFTDKKNLTDEEKKILSYGILEDLTKYKGDDIENGDIYEPDYDNFEEAYTAVRDFIIGNKIKPLNDLHYLDDHIIQNMAFGESTTISPFKQQFMKYLNNNLQDITLKEDDSPEDFATNIKADIDTTASDVSQNSLNDQGDADLNLDADSSMGSEDGESGVNFGDININGGAGDYGPEEDEQMQGMPIEPVDEYKIIDVLVNDDNNEDIRVKVQNLTTGEIETKELSEIDI